jgi:protein-S-isoprenylcysteine O-methyltransferase Ste14
MSDDELVQEAEDERRRSAAARLFDVRRVIGGLFVVYGVIVGLVGVFDGSSAIDKAQGVRINLWAGLAMLVVGLLFLLWQWLSPAEAPEPPDAADSADQDVENREGDASVR